MARILLVEDDDAVREILRKSLVSAGHDVEEAVNGAVAILVMPEKDGLEAILELRRLDPAVKIIAMSGGGRNLGPGQLYLESARLFCALQILAKPFNAAAAAGRRFRGAIGLLTRGGVYRGVWVAKTRVRPCLSNERTW